MLKKRRTRSLLFYCPRVRKPALNLSSRARPDKPLNLAARRRYSTSRFILGNLRSFVLSARNFHAGLSGMYVKRVHRPEQYLRFLARRFPYLLPNVVGATMALVATPLVLCFFPETLVSGASSGET